MSGRSGFGRSVPVRAAELGLQPACREVVFQAASDQHQVGACVRKRRPRHLPNAGFSGEKYPLAGAAGHALKVLPQTPGAATSLKDLPRWAMAGRLRFQNSKVAALRHLDDQRVVLAGSTIVFIEASQQLGSLRLSPAPAFETPLQLPPRGA
jgi:hypothetical protein